MADRKQTPDILAEVLGANPVESGAATTPAQPAAASLRDTRKRGTQSQAAAAPKSPKASSKTNPPAKTSAWTYRVASFQEHRGWRLRFIDGQEQPGWGEGALLHEYLAQAAAEGWELAAASSGENLYGAGDRRQLFLRRLAA